MKDMFEEIIHVIKSLDSSTHKRLIIMIVATVILCIFIVVNVENPVINRWREERETEQMFEQRQSEREERIRQREEQELEEDKTEEDKTEEGQDTTNKEPVY